jgi:hypothetical protein
MAKLPGFLRRGRPPIGLTIRNSEAASQGVGFVSVKITDKDKGYAKTLENAAKAKHGTVKVGILAAEGSESANKSPGLTVIDVATFNEFGLGVPERSFVRGYVDENENLIRNDIKKLALLIVQGKKTTEDALGLLGMKVQGEMQKRISEGIDPPNAPSTIAKKGSSKPLIDTGQLRASITYKVEK